MTKTLLIMLVCTAIIIGGLTYVTLMTRATSARTLMPFQMDPKDVIYSRIPKFITLPGGSKLFVEMVGRSEDGKIALPSSPLNAAWYASEYKLGERGSVVIAGVEKNPDGSPGIFSGLGNIKKGDVIVVMDTSDKEYSYVVDEVSSYDWGPESRARIFNFYEKPYLNIIAYGYSYEKQMYEYPQTIIYTHLK